MIGTCHVQFLGKLLVAAPLAYLILKENSDKHKALNLLSVSSICMFIKKTVFP